jgi:hypothetical protein
MHDGYSLDFNSFMVIQVIVTAGIVTLVLAVGFVVR